MSFNEEDKENVYKAIKRVSEDNDKLVPIAKDPGGNYFCLFYGKVVFWSHEDGETIEAADSFESFYVCIITCHKRVEFYGRSM